MPVQPDAQRADQHAEELVDDLQPADGRRTYPPNQRRRALLQPEPLRQRDRRERDDEERDEPVFGEGAAEHVEDAFGAGVPPVTASSGA